MSLLSTSKLESPPHVYSLYLSPSLFNFTSSSGLAVLPLNLPSTTLEIHFPTFQLSQIIRPSSITWTLSKTLAASKKPSFRASSSCADGVAQKRKRESPVARALAFDMCWLIYSCTGGALWERARARAFYHRRANLPDIPGGASTGVQNRWEHFVLRGLIVFARLSILDYFSRDYACITSLSFDAACNHVFFSLSVRSRCIYRPVVLSLWIEVFCE